MSMSNEQTFSESKYSENESKKFTKKKKHKTASLPDLFLQTFFGLHCQLHKSAMRATIIITDVSKCEGSNCLITPKRH